MQMLKHGFSLSGAVSFPNKHNHTRLQRVSQISPPFPLKSSIKFCPTSHLSQSFGSSHFIPISSLILKRNDFKIKAKKDDAHAPYKKSNMAETVMLGLLFGMWYLFNIYFNIFNKQVLQVFPYPVTMTLIHLGVGTVITILMWAFKLHKFSNVSVAQVLKILPLALVNTLDSLCINISLVKVSVAFAHTIVGMEPFFTVLLAAMFREMPASWAISSLVPIAGGVVLASQTEPSFNWIGYWRLMTSNVLNQLLKTLSRKFTVKKEEPLDSITLFSVITISSFFLFTPVALLVDGVKFTPAYLQSAGLNVKHVYIMMLFASICFHLYQQAKWSWKYFSLGKKDIFRWIIGGFYDDDDDNDVGEVDATFY